MIRLKYFQKFPNVGDQLSLGVCQKYFSENVSPHQQEKLSLPNLLIIGSIFEWADECSYVCGAGMILPDSKVQCIPKFVACVRGPLTGGFLGKQGLDQINLFGDPGLLISQIYKNKKDTKYKVGIVPHYVDKLLVSTLDIENDDVCVIDVFLPPEEFSQKVNECEAIISSSLHGVVIAHAYEIPALWVEFSDKIIGDGFKFYDYYLSVGVSPDKVKRVKVSSSTNFLGLQNLATIVNVEKTVSMIEEAIHLTRNKLEG